MTLYSINIKWSRNSYGGVQLQCTEKNKRWFLANNLPAVTGTNTASRTSKESGGNILAYFY